MEIYNNNDVILIRKEQQQLAVAKAWHGDYISIETSPFSEETITFEIANNNGTPEEKIYKAFNDCIDNFISIKKELGFTPAALRVNETKRKIEFFKIQ